MVWDTLIPGWPTCCSCLLLASSFRWGSSLAWTTSSTPVLLNWRSIYWDRIQCLSDCRHLGDRCKSTRGRKAEDSCSVLIPVHKEGVQKILIAWVSSKKVLARMVVSSQSCLFKRSKFPNKGPAEVPHYTQTLTETGLRLTEGELIRVGGSSPSSVVALLTQWRSSQPILLQRSGLDMLVATSRRDPTKWEQTSTDGSSNDDDSPSQADREALQFRVRYPNEALGHENCSQSQVLSTQIRQNPLPEEP